MKGIIIKHLGREVKVGAQDSQVLAIAHIMHNDSTDDGIFHLQVSVLDGDNFVHSYQIAAEGLDVEIEMADIEDVSAPITEENHRETCQTDPKCARIFEEWQSDEFRLQQKLERFRKLETILRQEGLI